MNNIIRVRKDREINDYYATAPEAARWLCKLENFNGPIWECACGEGHLAKEIEKAGYKIKATDLINRNYGQQLDFLKNNLKSYNGNIVTNPPFKFAELFIRESLRLVPQGKKVCMFLRLAFLESKGRRDLFKNFPPKTIYVSSARIWAAKNGRFDLMKGSGIAFIWIIWQKGYKGETILKWFN